MTTIISKRLSARLHGSSPVLVGPDHIAAYLERLGLRGYSRHTIRSYRRDLYLCQTHIRRPLLEATPEDLDGFVRWVAGRGVKGGTVRKRMNTLRSFYKDAIKRELLQRDPTRRFESPKVDERIPVHLSAAQVEALLGTLTDTSRRARREATIIKTLYFTGMRSCELIGLDWSNIDIDNRELVVFGKGRKERKLPICSALVEALATWREVHPTGSGPVFVTLDAPHGRMCYDAMARVVRAAIGRAGLAGRKFSAHKLRHTFATRLVNQGIPIEKIQKLLGHASIQTSTIYAHVELERGIASTLDALL